MSDVVPMGDVIPLNTVSLSGAQRVLTAGLARAGELGRPVCLTVCDLGGEPVLSARMDGAPRLSAGIAADKAWSVTAFAGLPTSAWWEAIKDDPALVHGLTKTPRLIIFAGGVPLRAGGELVGAVGVSGGSSDEDHDIATAAAAVMS